MFKKKSITKKQFRKISRSKTFIFEKILIVKKTFKNSTNIFFTKMYTFIYLNLVCFCKVKSFEKQLNNSYQVMTNKLYRAQVS